MRLRLNRYLAMAGIASRRACEDLIRQGLVEVNGKPVHLLSTEIDPEKDRITFDGRPVKVESKHLYILLHKPLNYITTADDEKGRDSVLDLINIAERVFPVGRLDYDTTGLLLVTNDGELAHRLMHPKYGVDKTYLAELNAKITDEQMAKLRKGIRLSDGLTAPCKAVKIGKELVEITIHEGRNKQVKRMFRKLGFKVRALHRVRYGPISLGKLKYGQWRHLKPFETEALKQIAGMIPDEQKTDHHDRRAGLIGKKHDG